MTLIYAVGEGGRPSYAVHSDELSIEDLPDRPGAVEILRGTGTPDAVERLEQAGQAISDACEHLLVRVRDGLAAAAPDEIELTVNVSFAGEGGLPIIGKASAEGGIQVRALWSSPRRSAPGDRGSD